MSGSWSRGRTERYGYYHCPRCPGIRFPLQEMERLFLARLEELRPDPGYLRLFRQIVIDVWRTEQRNARSLVKAKAARLAELLERLEQLEEAFIFRHAIDQETYERQRARLTEQRTLAEMELDDARAEDLDVEGLLGFAEHLINHAGRLWQEASLPQRQQLQAALFPDGLVFDGRSIGTGRTCFAFNVLQEARTKNEGMASPPGFEPGFQP